jgi:hypothetical protein
MGHGGFLPIGPVGFVDSHLNGKNKDAAKVGHPVYLAVEG